MSKPRVSQRACTSHALSCRQSIQHPCVTALPIQLFNFFFCDSASVPSHISYPLIHYNIHSFNNFFGTNIYGRSCSVLSIRDKQKTREHIWTQFSGHSSLFCCCDKHQMQLRGRKGLQGLYFQIPIHHCGKSGQELRGGWKVLLAVVLSGLHAHAQIAFLCSQRLPAY